MESAQSAIDTGQVILSWPKMEREFCRIEAIGLVYVDFERLYEGIFLFLLIFTHFLLIFYSLFAHFLLILDLLLVLFLAFLSHLDFSFFTLFQKVVLGNFAETGKG